MTTGSTLGEEIIFEDNYDFTRESCICESEESCLLQISIGDFLSFGEDRGKIKGGGDGLQKDFNILL